MSASIHFLGSEDTSRNLRPFTLLGELVDLRVGILTIREKWGHIVSRTNTRGILEVPFNMIPSADWTPQASAEEYRLIERPWHLAQFNHWAIRQDFEMITHGRTSAPIPAHVKHSGTRIFIEQGAHLEHVVLNATEGPIHIGKDAKLLDGALLRGPVSVGEGATVKMGAQIYGGTTIGAHAVAGGEIKNSILSDYSNKGHHGYLGDAVVGRWCNLGAGTSCSNVKNNAGTVKVMDMWSGEYLHAGQKCGLIMGDFSRSAINTSFNTGTVTGVCVNVFGSNGLTPKFIPSFSHGNTGERSDLAKEIQSITAWMRMKGQMPGKDLLEKIERTYSMTNP